METMPNKQFNRSNRFSLMTRLKIAIAIVVVVCLGIFVWKLFSSKNGFSLSPNNDINITPTQIQSIRDIGQWEFLAINNEEIIDTVRHGFFGDAELVRIYYGTLRLGIDLQDTDKDFIRVQGDSILVQLPPIKLLDHQFIDEARTTSFFEKGDWTAKDRDDMYQRAYEAMLERCLVEQNIKSAERNANQQFFRLMKAMGHENVIIRNTPYMQKPEK